MQKEVRRVLLNISYGLLNDLTNIKYDGQLENLIRIKKIYKKCQPLLELILKEFRERLTDYEVVILQDMIKKMKKFNQEDKAITQIMLTINVIEHLMIYNAEYKKRGY